MRARLVPFAETRDLDDAWRTLAANALEPNAFCEPSMLTSPHLLAGGSEARLLVVEDGTRLTFALPIVRRRSFRRVPVAAAVTWRHPYFYLGTPLVDAADPEQAWCVALDLLGAAAPWTALELMPLDGPVFAALSGCLRSRGQRWRVFEPHERAILLRRPVQDYLNGRISARHLKSLRRQRRRLAERSNGDVHVRNYGGTPCRAQAVDEFLAMEARGWKGRDGGAVACDPRHADWLRTATAALDAEQRLEVYALCANDQAVAYQLNVRAGATVHHFKITYDEAYREFSPGLQLELAMIDAFHDDHRLECIDSCTAAGTHVSEQLYPDRRRIATVVIGASRTGRLLAGALPVAAAAYDRLRIRHGRSRR